MPVFEPVRVLHVVECWGGGVSTAVAAHIRATPGHEHSLLSADRPGEATGVDLGGLVRAWMDLPAGRLARIRAVGRAFAAIRPDLVHAHSSFAGLYVRACPTVPGRRIVYSPHCYGFERTDLTGAVRLGLRLAEAVLARRTGVVAAVSQREASLARRLRPGGQVVHVPNAVPGWSAAAEGPGRRHRLPAAEGADRRRHPVVAVTAGRICAQKDPEFLAQASIRSDDAVRWIWIGDGDPAARARLREAGVEVTGWLPNAEVLRLLRNADVYVHAAAWESAPMALLEAVAAGLPVVGRRIEALAELGVPDLVETPAELAAAVRALADPEERIRATRRVRVALRENTPQVQAARLAEAYGLVTRAEDLPMAADEPWPSNSFARAGETTLRRG